MKTTTLRDLTNGGFTEFKVEGREALGKKIGDLAQIYEEIDGEMKQVYFGEFKYVERYFDNE